MSTILNSMNVQTLPVPDFFDPKNAERWDFRPNQQQLFEDAEKWRKAHNLKAAAQQTANVRLLIIDAQKDFCFPEGSLYVAGRSGRGAMDDNARTAEFIYRNLGIIKDIITTYDTHFALQLFFASMWEDEAGNPLKPHTMIMLSADGRTFQNVVPNGAGGLLVVNENVRPRLAVAAALGLGYTWLVSQLKFYCSELARKGKYTLYLWPFHCVLGSDGHALAGVIHEARMFFSFARISQSEGEVKGGHALTENYSVLSPEVLMRHDGRALTQKNERFIRTLMNSDTVIIVGQAASHCVKSTIEDLKEEIAAVDQKLCEKVYVVRDLMSAVTVPDGQGGFVADFTPDAEQAFDLFASAGMHVVESTTPVADWPGIRL